MQRINLWLNPKFDPTGFHVVKKGGDISKYMTGGTLANTRGEYIDLPFACEVGVKYVCTFRIVSNDTNKNIGIYSGSMSKYPSAQTVGKYTIHFTPIANDTRLGIPSGMAISELSVEAADTYDAALGGGASGLLHRRHHATRLTPRTGTVVPDDGHEPMHEPILDHHPESRQVGEYHDPSEREWGDISDQRRGERHRRHYLDNRSGWRHQRKTTCQLQDDHQQFPSGINELSRQVRQSDRHSDEHAHLHVGRIPGEQDPARQPPIFHRGYDAARLTPMGVVA
ncbi:hypothetical protein [Bifidobacterium adolescentis]|uniref:hypothetical protein n=1 Tax=Bifidobacterium adolescentis TaxID=1680 RepID=UPI0015F33B9D|nr:hypothetical protein [Bifidobacterium adolescentis]